MKKPTRKLQLQTQTLRPLTPADLRDAVGGSFEPVATAACFIMKDSIIVRTSSR